MRVQFSVNSKEFQKLTILSKGYPDISTYCKDVSLQDRTYGNLWKQVTEKIGKMESGDEPFALRDLIPTPPANMGVKLFQNQGKLGIKFVKKDSLNTDTYIKI